MEVLERALFVGHQRPTLASRHNTVATRHRARMLRTAGIMDIASEEWAGSRVTISLPLNLSSVVSVGYFRSRPPNC